MTILVYRFGVGGVPVYYHIIDYEHYNKVNMDNQENANKHTYGVWIPSEGWVRGKDNKVFADYSISKCNQVARLLGRGARVYFIDPSIVDLEKQYLEQERNSTWHTFKNLFKHSNSK